MTTTRLRCALALAATVLGTGPSAAEDGATDLGRLLWGHGGVERRVDVHGRAVSAGDLTDRLAVVSFLSAGCTILCVTRTMDLDRLARDLPAGLRSRVVFLAIDTDPAADDVARLRTFADDLLGPTARLRVLPSDAEGTKVVLETLRYPSASLPEPPPTILLFDRRGRIAMTYGGDPLDAPRLERDIAALDSFSDGLDRPAPPRP
ncbi:SCO family protein [Methylobacterium sp. J-076]|uniref:SCO family protein n=1 Tax=Methylobacterium sp. J-076 TaxID=2836655 RepID=UPI001FBB620E|nr:SCO family protein [Methylobacterium sp. J-076]MCJ2015123.1 SCO family protein [Methylobacterium sp. J-076]